MARLRTGEETSRKRTVPLLILGLGGCAFLLIGLAWGTVLRTFAADLARTENFFNLINPGLVSLDHAVVAGIVGLGHLLLIFGVAAALIGLIWAAYPLLSRSLGNSGGRTSGFRRAFVAGSVALVLLAVGGTAWVTSTVSYEDELAAEPGGPTAGSAGEREEHAQCDEPPTLEQQQAADELAAETRAGVAEYADLSVAEAAGYRPSSPSWRPITHYLNPAYQRDGEILDPDRPEALVYANTSEGPILLGAMYVMPEPGDPGPRIGGCITQWHAHSLHGWETPEMMHVWSVDVPGGAFAELRPREFVRSLESQAGRAR